MNDPFSLTSDAAAPGSLMAYALLAFVLTLVFTRLLIGWLSARQFGKVIRVDGPDHAAKAGTPTMGGLGMLAAIAIVGGLLTWESSRAGMPYVAWHVALPLLAMLGFGVLGLIDDLQGLARKSGGRELGVGLTARRMVVAQVLVAAGLLIIARQVGIDVVAKGSGALLIIAIVGTVVLVGTVNGVNISDGLDGLAAGLLALAFGWVAWFGTAKLAMLQAAEMAPESMAVEQAWSGTALAAIMAAACLAFLVYNRHPARVFMGNVASMGLGGALAMLSILSVAYIFLPIFGIVFVAEVLSDIIQVGYFKWTGGKRFFRMAPIHHHFEKGGMSETQVVRRFWAVGLAGGIAAIVAMRMLVG